MASNQKCPRPVSARRLLKLRFEPIPMREEAYAGLVTWFLVTAGKLVDCIVKSGYPHFLWITLCMNRSKQANYGPVTQVSFVCAKTKQNKNTYDTKAYRNALPLDILRADVYYKNDATAKAVHKIQHLCRDGVCGPYR